MGKSRQPIKFVNLVVPSLCETEPYNNVEYSVAFLYWIGMEHYVIPGNIHTSTTEGIFSKIPPPQEIPTKLHTVHFFKFFGLTEPPTPHEIPILSVGGGGYGYFLEQHILYKICFIPLFHMHYYTMQCKYYNITKQQNKGQHEIVP